jgi:protein-tyrosine phosphatase
MKDIFWIRHEDEPRLAIVSRPRGGDWLKNDLLKLRQYGIDVLVSMLTSEESEELDLADERLVAEGVGLTFQSFPIPDRAVPEDTEAFRAFIHGLANDVRAGKRIGVHCRMCIGRSTLTAASTLRDLGWSGTGALSLVEDARGCSVPDTSEQRRWIVTFQP